MGSKQNDSIISAKDLRTKDFKKTMRGYCTEEVNHFLGRLAGQQENVDKVESELRDKVKSLQEELQRWRLREEELTELRTKVMLEKQQTLELTSKEAEKIMSDVHAKAEQIQARAVNWLSEIIEKVENLEQRRQSFVTAFRSALDSHYELLNQDEQNPLLKDEELHSFLKNPRNADDSHQNIN